MEYTNVVIGVQARSTSERFPRKVFEEIGGKPMLKHVLDNCDRSAQYLNNYTYKTRVMVNVALLIPTGDEIGSVFRRRVVVEGPEHDVLTRYKLMADRMQADYVVRVTGDCPLLPPFLITKHIKTAIVNGYDYLSNVDEESRTAPDGNDVEVLSAKMLKYLDETATEAQDREHVTTLARRSPPDWARVGYVVNFLHLAHLKFSVDTPEDLERVRSQYEQLQLARKRAEDRHGKTNVHSV